MRRGLNFNDVERNTRGQTYYVSKSAGIDTIRSPVPSADLGKRQSMVSFQIRMLGSYLSSGI